MTSNTPILITDTIGDAGRLLVTPHTEEVEVRSWLDAAYGTPAWMRSTLDEETSAGMIKAIDTVLDITGGRGTAEQHEFVTASLGLKIEDITEWDSSILDWRPSGRLGREITATAPDGAEIRFSADVEGDEITAHFIVELPEKEFGRKFFSTADTNDWPVIERYTPRDEWPTCMWAGQHGPKQRNPAPEVQAIIKAAAASRAESFAEDYRVILEWTRGEHLRSDWLHPDAFIIEDWTVHIWKVVEAGADEKDFANYGEPPEWLADLCDGFKVDPEDENPVDTTEGAPFEDAEERLLRKAGLPSSIVIRVDGPW